MPGCAGDAVLLSADYRGGYEWPASSAAVAARKVRGPWRGLIHGAGGGRPGWPRLRDACSPCRCRHACRAALCRWWFADCPVLSGSDKLTAAVVLRCSFYYLITACYGVLLVVFLPSLISVMSLALLYCSRDCLRDGPRESRGPHVFPSCDCAAGLSLVFLFLSIFRSFNLSIFRSCLRSFLRPCFSLAFTLLSAHASRISRSAWLLYSSGDLDLARVLSPRPARSV